MTNKMCTKKVLTVFPSTVNRPCILTDGHEGDHRDISGLTATNHGPLKVFKIEWLSGKTEVIAAHRMVIDRDERHRTMAVVFWEEYRTLRVVNASQIKQAFETTTLEVNLNINGVNVAVPVNVKA